MAAVRESVGKRPREDGIELLDNALGWFIRKPGYTWNFANEEWDKRKRLPIGLLHGLRNGPEPLL